MTEVMCHIGGYDVLAAYKLIWQLFALNALTFSAIIAVALIIRKLGRKARRPYHV